MKAIKQGICLALIGAGLVAVPVTLAQASGPAATSASSSVADRGLVQDMRDTARGAVKASTRSATGELGFARVSSGGDLLPGVSGDSKAEAGAKANQYLAKFGGAFGAGQGELSRSELASDGYGGWTATYTQSYKGVPVFGALLRAHINGAGALTSVNGYAAPGIDLSTDARRTPAQAGSRAVEFVKSSPSDAAAGGSVTASGLRAKSTDLVIYRHGAIKGEEGANTLAYVVEVVGAGVREKVFVGAQSGKVLNRYSMMHNDLYRELYEESPDPADLVWEEGDPLTGLTEEQLNLVHGTGESFWFFKNAFNRDSYDAAGARMRTVNNDPTIACPNANWNGNTTNYCNGVTSDDVVAHEWGHAYTEHTHGLIYQWQPGALNEAYSDIWGETVDLVNDRMDGDEGDINGKRPVGLCSSHTRGDVALFINSPPELVKECEAAPASFGPVIDDTGFTDDVVVAAPLDACAPLTNGAAVSGKFAYVDRGTCTFDTKVDNAEAAGATGIIVGNNSPAALISMSGSAGIPGLMITQADGTLIKGAASPVNATMRDIQTEPVVDSFRWLMGEDSFAFGGAIRDLWNPNCYGDPGKVGDVQYHCDTTDAGGVHSNSGVPNHGYSLLVDGGTYNGVTVTGIGLTKAAHIYYQAMTAYQTPVSDFADHADALAASCTDLVGRQLKNLSTAPNDASTHVQKITAADCVEVNDAAAAVQLRTEPTQCDFEPQLDPNTPALCGAGTGARTSFLDDFEDGLGDWTLTSTSVFGGPTFDWETSTDLPPDNKPAGSTASAFGPAGDGGACSGDTDDYSQVSYMTSPEIVVGQAGDVGPRLVFDHNIQTELGFDGGTVQVSVEGGAFETVPEAAYVHNEPTVLATEAEGSTNPLAGEDGFTGTDGGEIVSDWGTSIIDLTAIGVAVGDTIELRYAVGRDGCGGVFGWWVDNVRVATCRTLAPSNITAAHVPEPSTYGSASSVNVTVTGTGSGTATGTVTVKEGATTLGTGTLSATGSASVALPATLAAGVHTLAVSYSNGNYADSTKNITATVNKAASTITASAPKKVQHKQDFDVTASVSAAGGAPTGTVEVYKGSKLLGTGTLSGGTVTIHITKNLKPGKKHTLTVKYLGSPNVAGSETTVKVKVKKKKPNN